MVTRDAQQVGTVSITAMGLYCRISCRCRVGGQGIHRLYAGQEKLGVLVPEGNALVLETTVAAKRLKEGCCFTLDGPGEVFTPICSDRPFPGLRYVREGRLVFRDGKPWLAKR